jgi:uncharacterized protein (TIRG00374 family)
MLKSSRFWIGLAISLLFLWLTLRGLSIRDLLVSLRGTRLEFLLLAMAFYVVGYAARIVRWRMLFHPVRPDLRNIFHAFNIGSIFNSLLPARLGDLVRAYFAGRDPKMSKAHALSTIIVERFWDTIAIVVILGGVSIGLPAVPTLIKKTAWAALAAGILGLLVLVHISLHQDGYRRLLIRIGGRLRLSTTSRAWSLLDSLLDGLALVGRNKRTVGLSLWSMFIWACSGGMFFALARALRIGISWQAACLVMTATSIVSLIPSSPGGIGVYHFAAQALLTSTFGVERPAAVGFALLSHSLTYLSTILLGVYSMWKLGVTAKGNPRMWAKGRFGE